MLKYKLTIFILLMTVFICAKAYCQQNTQGHHIGVISGKVSFIDPEGSILTVKTDNGNVELYISVESYLFSGTKPMTSIEIEKDDFVTAEFDNSSGKNIITTLTDHNPDKIASGYTLLKINREMS